MAKTFVKLHLFSLTEFDRVIALDVDIIVRRNIDHLFSAACRRRCSTATGPTEA